ncbi:MAG: hypothetical protein K5770_17090 [Lachnospiraceae bacterium]|nr:hypothetical protein [Lachnospiraceae bacterium]
MGGNIFSILISTIKSRFVNILAKLRMWTSWNFIRAKLTSIVRDLFTKVLNIKPKNKDDYFTVFGWMISKRLAYAVIVIVGVLSFWYISSTTKLFSSFTDNKGLRTYKYNSILLRLAEGNVRITGKSGFLAYEGNVSKGYAQGQGTLFSPDDITLYNGTFEKNMYEGNGKQYYESGALCYTGTFHENLYEGSGTLFREDGTREYEGEFSAGHKEGAGTLYGNGDEPVYQGTFSSDMIVYGELLGKDAAGVREMYKGSQVMYEDATDDTGIVMSLPDIDALYYAVSDGSAADDTMKVKTVYVLQDTFRVGERVAVDAGQLDQILGSPVYEGNSVVTLPEAIAINLRNDDKKALKGKVSMETNAVYSDDIIVNNFDSNYSVYVYTYQKGSLAYSFICRERGGRFFFYEISDAGGES